MNRFFKRLFDWVSSFWEPQLWIKSNYLTNLRTALITNRGLVPTLIKIVQHWFKPSILNSDWKRRFQALGLNIDVYTPPKKEEATLKLSSLKLGTCQGRNSFTLAYQNSFQSWCFELVWPPYMRFNTRFPFLHGTSFVYLFICFCFGHISP